MTRHQPIRVSARLNMVRSVMHAINPQIPDLVVIEHLGRPTVPAGIPPAFPLQPEPQATMNTQAKQPNVEKTHIRKLSQKDFFRLCEWTRKNVEEGAEVTQVSLAAQASRDLSLEIAPGSIATALQATEITIRSPAGKGGSTPYKTSLGAVARAILLLERNEPFPAALVKQLEEMTKWSSSPPLTS